MAMIHSFRMFAIKAHGDQRYGEHPYAVHLAHVEHILEQHGYGTDKWRAKAWLHDLFEDTCKPEEMDLMRRMVRELFSDEVEEDCWSVSGFGATRALRNACIKEKILINPRSAILKCADRLGNVEFSSGTRKHGMVKKYREENVEFELYIRPHVPEAMWNRLVRSLFDKD